MARTPINERLHASTSVPGGHFVPNGLRCFIDRFSTRESVREFVKWRENPVTIAYLAALRTLSVTPPAAYVQPESVEVQFGVQSGVSLALSLAEDPTALYPGLFTGSTSGTDVALDASGVTEYTTAPDAT